MIDMKEMLIHVGILSVGLIVGFLFSAMLASNKRAWLEARFRSSENIIRLTIKVISHLCLWDTIEFDELRKEIEKYEED